jgi:hypothetical protein
MISSISQERVTPGIGKELGRSVIHPIEVVSDLCWAAEMLDDSLTDTLMDVTRIPLQVEPLITATCLLPRLTTLALIRYVHQRQTPEAPWIVNS